MTSCQLAFAATSFALALLISGPAVAEDSSEDVTYDRAIAFEEIDCAFDNALDERFKIGLIN